MVDVRVEPSCLKGDVIIPPSKSHTMRAILFAALSEGVSCIERFLISPDTQAMIDAVCLFGAEIEVTPDVLYIRGCAGKPRAASDVIQCGNAGQVLRFIGALGGLIPEYTILTGDASIRGNRPIKPLLDAMQQLGAFAVASRGGEHAPIIIKGPFSQRVATFDGQDSQPVSGLLIAAAFAPFPIELYVTDPGEKPWIDLTLHWLDKFGIAYEARNYTYYRVEGNSHIPGFRYRVPSDLSTAAFPLAAALLTRSELTLHGIDIDDVQGDKVLFSVLERMGSSVYIDKMQKTLSVGKLDQLQGMRIDANDFSDALPILAVIGCFAHGTTEIVNAQIARKKESDRVACMTRELKKMGARIEEREDGLVIQQSKLHGAVLNAHRDHRIALSLCIAAMAAESPSIIQGVECIDKTYPHFIRDFQSLGARIVC